MPTPVRKIAINTSGGDAPGLNTVVRAATLAAVERGIEIWGIKNGYRGLFDDTRGGLVRLDRDRVRGILHLGGTILGSANRGNPFAFPHASDEAVSVDLAREAVRRFRDLEFDGLIAIGGDGSLGIAHRLHSMGLPTVIGVPKTIDNDVRGTDLTFGFDTAVSIAVEAIGRLHTTAEAHDRVFVVEVMGRNAGWIALSAGIAGGADVILVPEIPSSYAPMVEKIMLRERRGRRFSIVVAAEGACVEGASPGHGGVAEQVARELGALTGKETRSLVLGHLQRGGEPTTYDRMLALRFGAAAVRFVAEGGASGLVALRGNAIELASLDEAASGIKLVPTECDTVMCAREMGLCFGDEPKGRFSNTL
jgi:ATP-dependent phosphofructokinase / diphosphate-dependent phosphofructokinase